jgi:hypothetical protein
MDLFLTFKILKNYLSPLETLATKFTFFFFFPEQVDNRSYERALPNQNDS